MVTIHQLHLELIQAQQRRLKGASIKERSCSLVPRVVPSSIVADLCLCHAIVEFIMFFWHEPMWFFLLR
ncbi:hypothetical protein PRUPE_6G132500 [Prunus persica]|uniref:Uncharacterized protein n=1 Tax=Prunus persica TaxID=3760 RepID=A0A251NPT1_PRUPE|nr:hypothetical protein PRUPE_6G132500 [Prunus persica]